jgi:hypothetical protein
MDVDMMTSRVKTLYYPTIRLMRQGFLKTSHRSKNTPKEFPRTGRVGVPFAAHAAGIGASFATISGDWGEGT